MRINYNVSAMLSNNALANSDKKLAASLQRLSTGLKVNRAKDNPAGLAMSKRMNAQIEGVNMASQNSSDGISVIEIADGALSEVADMLQRMNELCVKAANGTATTGDREIIQKEIDQLKTEIGRVSKTTQFNGQNLLDGSFGRKGFADDARVKVSEISDDVPAKQYKISSLTFTKATVDGVTSYAINPGDLVLDKAAGSDTAFPSQINENNCTIIDGILNIRGEGSEEFNIKLDVSGLLPDPSAENGTGTISDFTIDVLDIGAMRLQIGANESQVLEINIPDLNLKNYGIEDLRVTTEEAAKDGMDRIKNAINYLSDVRSRLGAYQNRLEHTISSLDITEENMTAAYSRIMDVDMAEEMTQYSTLQVMTQAGTSMLAQANERPSTVLQLLQ
ncbi:MAG: flagellin [Lachnospiraceae bacterium]|nr:flagellin [Lachnospiraceae bacterium]